MKGTRSLENLSNCSSRPSRPHRGTARGCLVFDGAAKGFCSGFDFTGFEDAGPGRPSLRFIRIETLLQLVYHAPHRDTCACPWQKLRCRRRPSYALVGTASLVLTQASACRDCAAVRHRAPGTRRLAARVGHDAARTLLETSATFDADQALQIGFATLIAEREVWRQNANGTAQVAEVLDRDAAALLYARLPGDTRDADMADMAKGDPTTPGLIGRITFRSAIATLKDSKEGLWTLH